MEGQHSETQQVGFPWRTAVLHLYRQESRPHAWKVQTRSSLRFYTSRDDEASLWLAVRPDRHTFDTQVKNRMKTHITWMAAASDMMVHSVL